MEKYNYILVGGGLYAGMFAWYARKNKRRCLAVEKRNHIDGSIYCEDAEGIHMHKYGVHTLHTGNRRVWGFVNFLAEFNRYTNGPVADYKGQMYNMPFNVNTFSRVWGTSTLDETKAIIEKQRTKITSEPKNLEEQVIRLVGRELYEELIKGHMERQWGRGCKELSAFTIERIPMRYIYDNNYSNDPYRGIPIGGYNVMVEKLSEDCDIRTSADYLKNREHYDDLGETMVYTGTIDAFYSCRFGKLEYHSLRFESQMLDRENHREVAVVNYTDRDTLYTRVIEHGHFEFGAQPKTVITREYPVSWQESMESYYPADNQKNRGLYQRYEELAKTESHVLFGDRLGEYKYYDMDEVTEPAMNRAEEIFG